MRIVADRELPLAETAFAEFGEISLVDGRRLDRNDLQGAEVLLVRSVTRVNRELLHGTPVRIVGTATAGTDHLDIAYLDERGIAYFNAAGCNARAVAEFVLACALLAGPMVTGQSTSLSIGIVGFGHVGKLVAAVFGALGFNCLVNDPPLAAQSNDLDFVSLDEVLGADIVTLHVPLSDAGSYRTRGLIGAAELRKMRDEVLLVNAARGGVIDEHALLEWASVRPRALALDCWIGEPLVDTRLMRCAALATPHIAGHTVEARLRATVMLARQLAAYLSVDPVWSPETDEPVDVAGLEDRSGEPSAALREVVLRCCDPRIATGWLRESLDCDEPERARLFDQRRRDAAVRREFSHYRIASSRLQSDTVSRLQALGFHTTMNGPA